MTGTEPPGPRRADVVDVHERYLACCNEHRFDDLGEFVSDQVGGSGADDGLSAYIDAGVTSRW